jgi:1-acyl-sn-glycerol-3-phosphate acyltransferase
MAPADDFTTAYRVTLRVLEPVVRGWGRLEVTGLEDLPESGPVLLAGNHDSYWDPVAIGIAALPRRQIYALAKSSLWSFPGLGPLLDGMAQIPVHRGQRDEAAMSRAIEELRAGACIGIFPEATRSLGRTLRARSGLGRLAEAVPEAEIVCVSVTGTVDFPRFPKRPRAKVDFFRPAGGGLRAGEAAADLPARLLLELRERAPIVIAGRRRSARRRALQAGG